MPPEILTKLDELIAATKAASLPLDARWLDAEGVASLLSFKPRYVLENIANRPDFPAPLRLDGSGHPRWRASEVIEWAMAQREKRVGRPRNATR